MGSLLSGDMLAFGELENYPARYHLNLSSWSRETWPDVTAVTMYYLSLGPSLLQQIIADDIGYPQGTLCTTNLSQGRTEKPARATADELRSFLSRRFRNFSRPNSFRTMKDENVSQDFVIIPNSRKRI